MSDVCTSIWHLSFCVDRQAKGGWSGPGWNRDRVKVQDRSRAMGKDVIDAGRGVKSEACANSMPEVWHLARQATTRLRMDCDLFHCRTKR